ncbi:PEP-CTERM sorting domain-containing protein [Methylomonas fluvii]|uniref:VPLPA-CTERM sorting domain-containing protein n=1 Tax=Methylomonas fluvii TaxID=1854564 RepID=A0ABR9DJY2_9GAMM|nr:PEP-CTERM sorting domain-containing protein [Methylomonas fluvii]MBD9363418.1 VPLPA-CTERM sorting domain-containing protein [Methylomonas fluvii]
MKYLHQSTLIASLLAVSGIANADYTNDPDPYAAGYGFDTPSEAAWGGWDRGDTGTLYAEWDTFVDSSYPGTRTAAPDVGSAGTTDANIGWNAGTFAAGSGNLYSFSVIEEFAATIAGSVASGPLRAVLQFETWGIPADYSSILLNGVAPTFTAQTFYDTSYPSSFGAVPFEQYLAYWDLSDAASVYQFTFSSDDPSLSLAQVALDIGPNAAGADPVTSVPLPAAVWLFGAGLMGLLGLNRKKGLAA